MGKHKSQDMFKNKSKDSIRTQKDKHIWAPEGKLGKGGPSVQSPASFLHTQFLLKRQLASLPVEIRHQRQGLPGLAELLVKKAKSATAWKVGISEMQLEHPEGFTERQI